MQELFVRILSVAYAAVGIVSTIAYWPTIKDLLAGHPSANTASYVLWASTTLVAFLYSLFVLTDPLFRFVSGLAFLSCTAILVLRLRLPEEGSR